MTAFPPSHTGRKYGYHTFRSPFYFPNNANLLLASTIDDLEQRTTLLNFSKKQFRWLKNWREIHG